MRQFSIIVPSFNRAKYLPRIYNSLCKQQDIDFEWIIVDDGSSDNTREIVAGFNQIFPIKYTYQENAGKPTAMNTGVNMANSYISVSLDSDDILLPNVLKSVWNLFDIQTGKFENSCACVSGLCQYDNGDVIGDKFPKDYYVSDHIKCRFNEKINGDKLEFVVTSVLKQYLFPIFKNEKNIVPGVIMFRMALSYKTLYVNQIFAEKQFLPGGLSTQNYWFMYPNGSELYYNEASVPPLSFKWQIKNSGQYIFFAKMNKKKKIYKNAKNKRIYLYGLFSYCIYSLKLLLKRIPFLQKLNNLLKFILVKKKTNYKVFKTEQL